MHIYCFAQNVCINFPASRQRIHFFTQAQNFAFQFASTARAIGLTLPSRVWISMHFWKASLLFNFYLLIVSFRGRIELWDWQKQFAEAKGH